jgi:hypothetical protein
MSRRLFSAPAEILKIQGTFDLLSGADGGFASFYSLPLQITRASILGVFYCLNAGKMAARYRDKFGSQLLFGRASPRSLAQSRLNYKFGRAHTPTSGRRSDAALDGGWNPKGRRRNFGQTHALQM